MNVRLVEQTQYINRIRSFDFDMVIGTFGQSSSPGNEQRNFWSSEAAKTAGSRNLIGIENEAVDRLLEKVISASDREQLELATRALDRVLLWNHYVIPQWQHQVRSFCLLEKIKQTRSDTCQRCFDYELVAHQRIAAH